MSAPETAYQHIEAARGLAARITVALGDAANGKPVDLEVIQVSVALAQVHAQVATAMLLDGAIGYSGALKVVAEGRY